jgi:trimeric autotransporter adhesin
MVTALARQNCGRTGQLLRMLLSAAMFAIANIAGNALAATITVTGTGDTVAVDGIVTLREAIMSINAGANVNADVVPVGAYGTADTINFNIGGAGVHTIAPSPFLPNITKPLTIDGYSQPGTSVNTHGPLLGTNAVLLIELNMAGGRALTVAGGNSTVRGLVINRAPGDAGIDLITNGGNLIIGNFIGTNPAGTAAGPGNAGGGVNIQGSPANRIGRAGAADMNVISGNPGNGILCCAAGVSGNVIQNNLIGTDATGTSALGNTAQGISMGTGTGNIVGSFSVAGRNVISANGQHGILLNSGSNFVQGNFVGTDVAGTAAIPNADGIFVAGGGNTIGGTAPGAGNLVSGNTTIGITLANQLVAGNTVQGNLVGTDVTGTVAIAGHSTAGVNVGPFSNDNVIGGTPSGAGNLIAFSAGNGVLVSGAAATGGTNNAILGNRILGNAKLGIKLGTNTSDTVPTPNDSGDADTGPNNLQNYPALTLATIAGGNVAISGTLNSTASTAFRVELFSNVVCDVSGNGEGQSFLGFATVTTDSGGNMSFGPVTVPVPSGQKLITATATDPANNTSEFSPCILATGPPALQSAASRKVHGAAGTFNVPLSLVVTNPTTEPRQGATATIVMTFDSAIISANAAVTEGTATAGAPTFSGNDVIVPLTGVTDQHYVTVSLTNVASATHTGGNGAVRLGFLLGDVNQNRVISVADLGLVNAQLAQVVTAANYLKDVNASGTLTVADKGITNANLTHALPAP